MPSPKLAFTLLSEQWFTVYGLVFDLNFVQSSDLSAFIYVAIMIFNIIFVCITRFYPNQPDPICSENTCPGTDLRFSCPTQH